MPISREGLVLFLAVLAAATVTLAVAVLRRSWPLWLVGFCLTLLSLGVAYVHRTADAPPPTGVAP